MPKHVVRLLLLMGAGLVLALVARSFLIPDSFFRFGHYRAASVTEIAAQQPVHRTSAYCEDCHDEQHAQWSASNHKSVACENCHGPARTHPKGGIKELPVPKDTIRLCSVCHEATAGRPAAQPQVVLAEHAPREECAGCHNPHSPRISADVKLTGNVEDGKRLAAKACAECHGDAGVSPNATWPSLAGFSAAYLVRITTAYKTGDQQDVAMTPLAKKLSDKDIQDVSAYYASLACGKTQAGTGRGDVAAGQSLAKNCARCHGETGIPTIRSWPLIAGQAPGYLVNVLKAFRAGLRKNPMMSNTAGSLSDTDIANLAAFYSAQQCGPAK
jgi:cytochrome c553